MKVITGPSAVKRIRQAHFKFQKTFHTPLKDLPRFTTTIMSAMQPMDGARFTLDQVVFPPKALIGLLSESSLSDDPIRGMCLEAQSRDEAKRLLHAALSDWVDFAFIPIPGRVVIYADHDEYITFLALRKGPLHDVVDALSRANFRPVDNYKLQL
jgi:hypothetical protein